MGETTSRETVVYWQYTTGAWWSNTLVMAALMGITVLTILCMVSPPCLPSPLSDGHGESIQAFYGFYGNPLYRPYGFGSWGFGSEGFGLRSIVSQPNSVYGGYYWA